MPYTVILSPQAEADFLSFPPGLQSFIEQNINRLAENPVQLSRRGAFPYPENAQLFHFDHPNLDGKAHFFTILFRYSQDETTIEIIGIGHMA